MNTNVLLILLLLMTYSQSRLIGFVELFRHGARTPLHYLSLAKDIFPNNYSGELTNKGETQLQSLGQMIKDKYFPDNMIEPDEYRAFAAGMPRCINSAKYHMQALTENTTFENYIYPSTPMNSFLKQNTVDNNFIQVGKPADYHKVDILDTQNDKLLATHQCYNKIKGLVKLEVFRDIDKQILIQGSKRYPAILKEIIDSDFNARVLKNLYDMISATNYHSKGYYDFPVEYMNILRKANLFINYDKELNDDSKKKTYSSNLFDMLTSFFDDLTVEPSRKLKYLFLAGKDTNIIDFISNIINQDYLKQEISKDYINEEAQSLLIPPFGSFLIFELHQGEDSLEYYVKIIYNDTEPFTSLGDVNGKSIIYYPGKGIPFNDFQNLLRSRIDWNYRNVICKDDTSRLI